MNKRQAKKKQRRFSENEYEIDLGMWDVSALPQNYCSYNDFDCVTALEEGEPNEGK